MSEEYFMSEEIKSLKRTIAEQSDLISTLKNDISVMSNFSSVMLEEKSQADERERELNSRLDSCKNQLRELQSALQNAEGMKTPNLKNIEEMAATIKSQRERIDSLKHHVSKCHEEMEVARNTPSAREFDSLREEKRQLLDGRDFLTKALDNAAKIEVKMAECLKDQRNRIDALERECGEHEANEEKHHNELIELRNELTITRDAYWYLKEKLGQ